jgi:site-specific DNA-methyltransferase (adenine-specific)
MTEPYYQDDLVTLYNADCLDTEAWLAADVLVTDPPYGVAFQSSWTTGTQQKAKIVGDDSTDARDMALGAWGDKPALVFGTWRAERPAGVRQRLIWAKGDDPGLGDLSMPWGYGDEEVYVLGRGWVGQRRSNVYRIPKVAYANNPGHPTPKPVPLMEALIEYAPPGVVADPFAGSGATLIAARNLGRRVIGVEIDESYCELIAKRLGQQAFDFGAIA